MKFKPMLAANCTDVTKLRFPVIVSPKLDGVRALTYEGQLLSRSLKPIPNKNVQALYAALPNGLDGELIAGDPCAPDAYRKTVSMVMAEDKPIDGLVYHLFDLHTSREAFKARYHALQALILDRARFGPIGNIVQVVRHTTISRVSDLEDFEGGTLAAGYEGVMLRDPLGLYKYGRSTEKEGGLLKLKRFADSEAEVIGAVELMHNGNEAKKNALGRTERSTAKAGKTGMGVLGALKVRDVKTGVEFEIGTGFTADERRTLWNRYQNRNADYGPASFLAKRFSPVGWLAKYKYFAGGSKDKPRFPVFLGWRDKRDR